MGQNITYSCDRCGHTQTSTQSYATNDARAAENPRAMYTVGVVLYQGAKPVWHDSNSRATYVPAADVVQTGMWCDACCSEVVGRPRVDMYSQRRSAEQAAASAAAARPRTMESMIEEMVEGMVSDAVSRRQES